MQNKLFSFIIILFCAISLNAQKAKKRAKKAKDTTVVLDKNLSLKKQSARTIDALAPSKAAFYSAVIPGLGQAYNKKYWKIPIVYGGLAVTGLIWDFNNKEYNRFRNALKSRFAGLTTDEFYGTDAEGNALSEPRVSNDGLIRAQQNSRRSRDLTMIIGVAWYVLNIIDANVDAHLKQFNVDDDLAIEPSINRNQFNGATSYGISIGYKF